MVLRRILESILGRKVHLNAWFLRYRVYREQCERQIYYLDDCNVDTHNNIESNIFEAWFNDTLIPNLQPGSFGYCFIPLNFERFHIKHRQKLKRWNFQ